MLPWAGCCRRNLKILYTKRGARGSRSLPVTFPDAVFSVGEAMNGNPFELACALVREGFAVRWIFGTVSKDSYVWLGILARLSPPGHQDLFKPPSLHAPLRQGRRILPPA